MAPVLAFPDYEKPFVLETDAASRASGAFLAQNKEDGRINPAQFASRTMNYAEGGYATFEREDRAVIFSLKKFRVYLLSSHPFVLLTYYQDLSYSFKKKDFHGLLALWMEFFA